MTTLPHPEDVRETVLRTFSELRRRIITAADVTETVLLRQGYYYGRAYRCTGVVATLTSETGALCFCSDDGQLIRTIELLSQPSDAVVLPQAA